MLWEKSEGIPFDSRGYVDTMEVNLRMPLLGAVGEAFGKGAGRSSNGT